VNKTAASAAQLAKCKS